MFSFSFIFLKRSAGIIGFPNVGKSTLFNALTCSQLADTGNFPFCTIKANVSKINVYDERLRTLAAFCHSQKIIDVQIEVSDVAGLIAGASKGAGLGNQFLNDIRRCNVVLHMVRCFENAKDGFGPADPINAIEVIHQELILSDIEAVEKKVSKLRSRKFNNSELLFTKKMLDWLEQSKLAKDLKLTNPMQESWLSEMQLFTAKPEVYVLNVPEEAVNGNDYSKMVEKKYGADVTCKVCSVLEEMTASMTREERASFMKEYGLEESATEGLLKNVYGALNLQSMFTIGPQMAHGWAIQKGTTARGAAGEIHGDFEKYFSYAMVCPWGEYLKYPNMGVAEKNGFKKVSDKYTMKDGDVIIVEHTAQKK